MLKFIKIIEKIDYQWIKFHSEKPIVFMLNIWVLVRRIHAEFLVYYVCMYGMYVRLQENVASKVNMAPGVSNVNSRK